MEEGGLISNARTTFSRLPPGEGLISPFRSPLRTHQSINGAPPMGWQIESMSQEGQKKISPGTGGEEGLNFNVILQILSPFYLKIFTYF